MNNISNNWPEILAKIKARMKELNMSGYRLAKMTMMAEPNLNRMLRDKQMPNIKTLIIICNALQIKIM